MSVVLGDWSLVSVTYRLRLAGIVVWGWTSMLTLDERDDASTKLA
jgi:hypothetical protein